MVSSKMVLLSQCHIFLENPTCPSTKAYSLLSIKSLLILTMARSLGINSLTGQQMHGIVYSALLSTPLPRLTQTNQGCIAADQLECTASRTSGRGARLIQRQVANCGVFMFVFPPMTFSLLSDLFLICMLMIIVDRWSVA